ncbi:ThiF family adenylyltransferase [Echinicola jeungdonensis]|uniref:ThiF family adenylyltransferase n=1 Tax=Echinicola jeungdonensis TaxID=709343 RepID=A0ABV5J866_9BACT|nr:ThiF family adenylyltransferase [Echinicola jeungdonensis]MDN3669924.1 ThiF family adenylyltransferase [Echinicola jeungdonensis]
MNFEKLEGICADYEPLILSGKSEESFSLLEEFQNDPAVQVVDTIRGQVAELIKIDHPSQNFTEKELDFQVKRFFEERLNREYGNWIFYPWKNQLVHTLPESDFIRLRTSRNKYKITPEEQDILQSKKIGVIGLSVGQSVALSLAMERSFGELRIADYDTLELSNMNRIRTGLENLGLKKAWIVAREIAEIDPYLKVKVFEDGIHDGNMDDFFEEGGILDLLVEECDSIPVKIKSRIKAKSLGIPVLMDTSDRGMLDIERFDLEPERPIFHGLVEDFGPEEELVVKLPELGNELMMSIIEYKKLSPRILKSFAEIGKSIRTWPQLASSVFLGGAACAHLSRTILLAQPLKSGRFYLDVDLLQSITYES